MWAIPLADPLPSARPSLGRYFCDMQRSTGWSYIARSWGDRAYYLLSSCLPGNKLDVQLLNYGKAAVGLQDLLAVVVFDVYLLMLRKRQQKCLYSILNNADVVSDAANQGQLP